MGQPSPEKTLLVAGALMILVPVVLVLGVFFVVFAVELGWGALLFVAVIAVVLAAALHRS